MGTITIKDIAKICGVGVSTVSRALNDHPDINPETKEKIRQAIRVYNYIPNNSARNLKRSDSNTIAVLVKGIGNPFFNGLIKVLEREIKKEHHTFILQRVDEREDEVDVALELEKEKKLKGIVFLGGYFYHAEEKLRQISVPYVLCTIGLGEEVDQSLYSSVSVDDLKESCRMVDYLCSLGHRRIAIIAAKPDDVSIGTLRYRGYIRALQKNGIQPDPDLVRVMKDGIETYSMQNGYAVAKELLDSGIPFTALYAISDDMAIGAAKAILEAGKKIPEDYSVAGFDGTQMGQFYHPSLTTMEQPGEKMAEEAIAMLFGLIEKKKKNQHKVFEARLLEGQSVRRLTEQERGEEKA